MFIYVEELKQRIKRKQNEIKEGIQEKKVEVVVDRENNIYIYIINDLP